MLKLLRIVIASICWSVAAAAPAPAPAPAPAGDGSPSFFMPLLGDLPAELESARKEQRSGIVLVYEMDGCPFCERLKRVALDHAEVRRFFHEHFLVFRLDVRGANPIVGFDGTETIESSFAARQAVRATPTVVFYDRAGGELVRFVGPPTDAAEFLLLGRYVVDGHYKAGTFETFRKAQRHPTK